MVKLYNFLSKNTEDFKPIEHGEVGMYTCGPTVYDFVHIGNWRTFIFEDVLKRVLKFNSYKVKHVMNITDIDDKIIKRAQTESKEISAVTNQFEKAFREDLKKLNIEVADMYPHATEYIPKMVDYIQKLIDKGFAYKEKDGSVYFDISKFPNYGKLSGVAGRQLKTGTRTLSDEYTKEDVQDFALWKSVSKGELGGFESKLGYGRPGWHIECSVMSQDSLGDTFDIHTGGIDLLFPHHENEIAQSQALYGDASFAQVWMEGEHLLVDGKKMSKSLGDFYKLSDIVEKGFDPLALRYLFLTAHYRSKLNFTWESLEGAHNALNKLREHIESWDEPKIGCAEFEEDFNQAVNNDLDMPKGLSVMWEMVKSDYPSSAKHQSVLKMDAVLGLGLNEVTKPELSKEVMELIEKREDVRKAGNYDESDKLRRELLAMGVEVEDTPQGPKWKVKK
ncbi:MAG TPA: cysteine--tRNA ligase [Candidatus Saccharimonadales bacterium]|nr:cysteine--tRNA ligase [Candidatus Saccharimonadales bacterium]